MRRLQRMVAPEASPVANGRKDADGGRRRRASLQNTAACLTRARESTEPQLAQLDELVERLRFEASAFVESPNDQRSTGRQRDDHAEGYDHMAAAIELADELVEACRRLQARLRITLDLAPRHAGRERLAQHEPRQPARRNFTRERRFAPTTV